MMDKTNTPKTFRIAQTPVQRSDREFPFTVEVDGSEIPLGGAVEVEVVMAAGAQTNEDMRMALENLAAPRPLYENHGLEIVGFGTLIVHEHNVDIADTTVSEPFLESAPEFFRVAIRARKWDFYRNNTHWTDWDYYFSEGGEFFHIAEEVVSEE